MDVCLECCRRGHLGVFAANFPLHVLMQGLRFVFRTEPGKRTQDRDILNGAFARKHVAERERACRKPFLRLIHKLGTYQQHIANRSVITVGRSPRDRR